MRIAIVSDIHGNLTALEAVLADLRLTAPDLILHGGDLADGGARPAEVLDRVRDLGWPGVIGNADEMLSRPESLEEFASQSPAPRGLFDAVREIAAATRDALGESRIAWLRELPRVQFHGPLALVHASPESVWRSPGTEAIDAELEAVYGPLKKPIAVYAHIHRPFIRAIAGQVVANTGSVSLPYDGDCRASYLLLDDDRPSVRRVEYDVEGELEALSLSGLPHADWIAKMLVTATFQMP